VVTCCILCECVIYMDMDVKVHAEYCVNLAEGDGKGKAEVPQAGDGKKKYK